MYECDSFSAEPLFLTHKLQVTNLSTRKNVYDFQLRDHFLNMSNLYVLQCTCPSHKHNKDPCIIVTEPICLKCKTPTKLLIGYQSLMFHENIFTRKLTSCCKHIHRPPCNRCINCQINLPCIVPAQFECTASTGK